MNFVLISYLAVAIMFAIHFVILAGFGLNPLTYVRKAWSTLCACQKPRPPPLITFNESCFPAIIVMKPPENRQADDLARVLYSSL